MILSSFRRSAPTHFIGFFLGMLGCFFLQKFALLSAVFSASLIGLLASFIPTKKTSTHLPSTLYAGAFIGMGTFLNVLNLSHLFITSTIAATIYSLGMPFFNGVGGRLGFIALLSTLIFLALKALT